MMDFSELLHSDFAITQVTPIYQYYSADDVLCVHNRLNNGLFFCSDCDVTYTSDNGACLRADRNSFVLLPEGSSYNIVFRSSDGSDNYNKISDYLINFKLLEGGFNLDFPYVISEKVSSATRLIIDDIFSIEAAKNRLKLYSSFYTLLNNLFCKKEAVDYLIQPAIDYLNLNPEFNSVSVNSLSKMCNMHPTTFRRHFEAAFGISPSQFIKDHFKKLANYHLITEQRTVKEVAYLLGFGNVSYFSRFYKENTGFLPSEIKKSIKENN